MNEIRIEIPEGKAAFSPGETINGSLSWQTSAAPSRAFVSLLWYTHGKGTSDNSIVEQQQLPNPVRQDRREFSFKLPVAPYSFSGKLISLTWAIELVLEPGTASQRLDFVMAPEAREILLTEDASLPIA